MQRSPPEVQGCCPTGLETALLRKMVLEAFDGIKFSLAAPKARRAVSRWRRVAFELHALRLEFRVQYRLQGFGGHKSQWERCSALRAALAALEAGDAAHECTVRGADDTVTQ